MQSVGFPSGVKLSALRHLALQHTVKAERTACLNCVHLCWQVGETFMTKVLQPVQRCRVFFFTSPYWTDALALLNATCKPPQGP